MNIGVEKKMIDIIVILVLFLFITTISILVANHFSRDTSKQSWFEFIKSKLIDFI